MKVFVEYAVIDNFVMDYLLLKLATFGRSNKSGIKKRVLGALIGTVVAVYMPLLDLPVVWGIVVRIITAMFMVFFACDYDCIRDYFVRLCLFLLYTAVFGGVIYTACGILGIGFDPLSNAFGGSVPLALPLLVGVGLFLVCKSGYYAIYRRRAVLPFVRRCIVYCEGQRIETTGFIDSGNSVMMGDECVCVVGQRLYKMLSVRGAFQSAKEVHTLTYVTAGGWAKMKVYRFDCLVVINGEEKNIIYGVMMGVPEALVDFGREYSLILPSEYAFLQ